MTTRKPGTSVWRQVYNLLDRATPLPWDCGRLCGAACCKKPPGEADEPGMLLYPGEDAYLLGLPKSRILPRELEEPGNKAWWAYLTDTASGKLLVCRGQEGECRRELRPFSCRIFPLAPFLVDGVLVLDLDPAGVHLCPLIQSKSSKWEVLDHHFIWQVRRAFSLLLPFEAVREHVKQNSWDNPYTWRQAPWAQLF